MRLLHNARLGTKLALITITALLIIVGLGVGGIVASGQMNRAAQSLINQKLMPARAMGEIRAALGALQYEYVTMNLGTNTGSYARSQVEGREGAIEAQAQTLLRAGLTGDEAQALADFQQQWGNYKKLSAALWQEYDQGGTAAIRPSHYNEIDSTLGVLDAVLRRLADKSELGIAAATAQLDQGAQMAQYAGGGAIALGAIVLLLLARAVRQSLLQPVATLTTLAEEISHGDLRRVVERTDRTDEIGRLHNSMEALSRYLRQLLVGVAKSSESVAESAGSTLTNLDQVNQAASQLAEAISRVAAGAGGQNEAVQQAVQVMEQMSVAIDQVARGARDQADHVQLTNRVTDQARTAVEQMAERVRSLADGSEAARAAAESGIVVVDRAVGSMEQLRQRVERTAEAAQQLEQESRQIRHAVELITELADQTNLLALNAAIEAARAGESGRGFAVVADEIRNLAERSGKSASEIAALIDSVQRRTVAVAAAMQEGSTEAKASSELTGDAGRALQRIMATVRATVQGMAELGKAADAMTAATAEADRAVEQIAAVVEENTATTEEMAASATEVGHSVTAIAEVAQETAATAEEVSASVEELSATTEHVAEAARSMAVVADELRAQVGKFRL
ncbi:MAG TPA: HAMP domain-containing methyl-accepting chemotaxis protein [Symbiobacteriaceae bacterium]|nr:HAMP domain-containing methyl-accepting chemotaxis protein [Symbiobacteriaceae bacterium]